MKKFNKFLLKIFSVMLSVMLLNLPVFAAGRYATINNNFSGAIGSRAEFAGTATNPLRFNDYNEDSGNGGDFLVEQGSDIVIWTRYAMFNNNTAKLNGGAIAQMSSSEEYNIIQNSGFDYNVATNGGAIYISDGNLRVSTIFAGDKSWFSNNKSTEKGGAVYNSGNFLVDEARESRDIYFRFNKAGTSGGAIYNCENAKTTIFDYVEFSSNTANAYGGAIYNETDGIVNIWRNVLFQGNSTERATGMGGAIYNAGNITISTSTKFQGNQANYRGGAIYNVVGAKLEIFSNSTFDDNTTAHSQSDGGAIYNTGSLSISDNVEFNRNSTVFSGGAISNYGDAAKLYVGNNVIFSSNTSNVKGGAISNRNTTKVAQIQTNVKFLNNEASEGDGGAVFNNGSIFHILENALFDSNVAGDNGGAISHNGGFFRVFSNAIFINNVAGIGGGAIHSDINDAESFSLEKNISFIKNSANDYGGAISITRGSFNIGSNVNFSSNVATNGHGGAIANFAGDLIIWTDSSFYGNRAKENGGAIYNFMFLDTLGKITIGDNADFTKNTSDLNGGAIYNRTGSITLGETTIFCENSSVRDGGAICNEEGTLNIGASTKFNSNTSGNNGGAINNYSTQAKIDFVSGTIFSSNTATNLGGALYNVGEITFGPATAFNGNKSSLKSGGAIYNLGSITTDNISFDGNSAKTTGGAIYNGENATILIEKNASFTNNTSADSNGGAIDNYGIMSLLGSVNSFSSNKSNNGYGGAIHNSGIITFAGDVNFTDNSSEDSGGAISNRLSGTIIMDKKAVFVGNSSNFGGAIYNDGTITFKNGAIVRDNITEIGDGGAIYNTGTLNLIAYTNSVEFTGNTSYGEKIAICCDGGITNLWASKNADVVFNDKIIGYASALININKSSGTLPTTGKIILNEDMSDYKGTVNFYNGTIELGENGAWFGGNVNVENSPTINMANSIVSEHNFHDLTINNDLKLIVDADLANGEMDTISATSFGNSSGKITVTGINILSDIDVNEIAEIEFADDVLKNKVESVDKASSVLYNYRVRYDKETGNFKFINGLNGKTKNMGTAASAVSATAGGAATQSLVANQVFASMDGKVSGIKKASTDSSNLYVSAGGQVFDNSGKTERGLWLKPFVTQETVKIGDADVDNNLYGTLAGIDFPMGQDKQVSFYLGYAGSKQEVEDVKSNQTGYILGATGMMIKENWYAGLTANVMFNKASIDTDFGTDDVDMNMFSIGAKAGYNYNVTDSFVLEPNLTLVYGVVNSDSYETSQGAEIDSQSVNNISVEPQVKAKLQMDNGWQPYGLLGYSANLGSKPTVKAEGVEIDLDSIDGYVEYGAGVNKDFIGTVWSCYAQVTGRSGGRNGFAGNLGIKYKF